jgi:putative transposase
VPMPTGFMYLTVILDWYSRYVLAWRLWRTVKYEDIYPKAYATVPALEEGLSSYFDFYSHRRIHQSLGYRPPVELYRAR